MRASAVGRSEGISSLPRRMAVAASSEGIFFSASARIWDAGTIVVLVLVAGAAPVVLVLSDAGVRGEGGDDASAAVGRSGAREAVDFRAVVPRELWSSPYVTQIAYVPLACVRVGC